MLSLGVLPISYWIAACILLGIISIILLILCTGKEKKKNSVTMTRYIKNEENDDSYRRSRASTNGTTSAEHQVDPRLSQHSNENRILPQIPQGNEQQTNGVPSTPDRSSVAGTPGAVSLDGTQRNSNSGSPKKSRRLPALPPPGTVDVASSRDNLQSNKEIDDTYEDMRDEKGGPPPLRPPEAEIVGSGDSDLYAKVTGDDLEKQEDDYDLYAQVGASDQTGEQETNSRSPDAVQEAAGSPASTSDEEPSMDSPTAVTYASVDKMKKTLSIKRPSPPTPSYGPPPPPPIPDRNFDEDDEGSVIVDFSQPSQPILEVETPQTRSSPDGPDTTSQTSQSPSRNQDSEESSGPAYDTLSVRESFAHQRLRQIVEDEQRNRYVNTNQAIDNGQSNNPSQPDVYSQIEDETPESVYESVSAPGSADGTVGVTGRNLPTGNGVGREDGYVTIEQIRARTPGNGTPANGDVPNNANSLYEDINLR